MATYSRVAMTAPNWRRPRACSWRERRTDMDLAEFVEQTLSEVLKGIRAAQSKEGGGAVGATGITVSLAHPNTSLLFAGYGDMIFTVVEFDVSVLAETSGGGQGALKVWSVGSIEAGGEGFGRHADRAGVWGALKN